MIYLYSLSFLIITVLDYCYSKEGNLISVYTFNMSLFYFVLIIEWLQFPLCICYLIFLKKERTTMHFLFTFSLIILNLIKWGFWFLAAGAATYKS